MDISIIIPTYNRKEKLKRCLESLFKQSYPLELFEIIVVDDGSRDGTQEMVKMLSKNYPNLRYFYQFNKGPAAARNLGIKQAQGRIIAFTDNDCILEDSWVRKMLEAHKIDNSVMAIGGVTKVNDRNIKSLVSQFLSNGAIKIYNNGKAQTIFLPTCNISLKKEYLREEFNESFILPAGEDLDFSWRLFKRGNRLVYKQDIEILHDCHSNLISFLRQAYMYGRGNYLVQHIHKDHPLLKEIKTKNNFIFLIGLLINFIKIPRFSYSLGTSLIYACRNLRFHEKFQVYIYFVLHKVMYLIGNAAERLRAIKICKNDKQGFPSQIKDIACRPGLVILDITHRCNISCNICEIRKDKPIKELTTAEVKNIIAQSIDWGVSEFVLSGGEALIRDDIFEILDFTRKRKYHIGIITNGILLTELFIKRLHPYLVSNTLSLTVSLDALTPQIHDDIRGNKGCFEKVFNGLKILSRLKNENPNINFNAISIILNENLEELLSVARTLKSLNVNSMQFQPLLANNLIMKERLGKVKYWVPRERLAVLDAVIDDLIDLRKRNPGFIRNSENNLLLVKKYFRGLLSNSDVRCQNADKTVLIAHNGDITTCFDCCGNIRKSYLRLIYSSKESEQARKKARDCKKPCLLPCFTDFE
jgi:MoaA/NifB/PqqE/SkfB family radical SAM enzyme/glycosyltransferase involved in cell wall biosynthesis